MRRRPPTRSLSRRSAPSGAESLSERPGSPLRARKRRKRPLASADIAVLPSPKALLLPSSPVLPAYLKIDGVNGGVECAAVGGAVNPKPRTTIDVADFRAAALTHLGWMSTSGSFKVDEEPLLKKALDDTIARCRAARSLEQIVDAFSDSGSSACFRAPPFVVETIKPVPLAPLGRTTTRRNYGKYVQVEPRSVAVSFREEDRKKPKLRFLVEFFAVLLLHRFYPPTRCSLPSVIYADTFGDGDGGGAGGAGGAGGGGQKSFRITGFLYENVSQRNLLFSLLRTGHEPASEDALRDLISDFFKTYSKLERIGIIDSDRTLYNIKAIKRKDQHSTSGPVASAPTDRFGFSVPAGGVASGASGKTGAGGFWPFYICHFDFSRARFLPLLGTAFDGNEDVREGVSAPVWGDRKSEAHTCFNATVKFARTVLVEINRADTRSYLIRLLSSVCGDAVPGPIARSNGDGQALALPITENWMHDTHRHTGWVCTLREENLKRNLGLL